MKEQQEKYNLPKGWVWAKIEDISLRIHYGYTASATQNNTGIKLLRITDIQDNKVNWGNVPFCDIQPNDIEKFELKENDIVFARTGATVGKSFLIPGNIPKSVFASYLIRIIPSRQINPGYIHYFFHTANYWQQIGVKAIGTGQPNVNATSLSNIIFPLCSINEQKLIVFQIETLFSKLHEAEKGLKKANKNLKIYSQILSKNAFEGKLTNSWRQENNLNNAENILKDIKTERKEYNKNIQSNWKERFSEWERNGKNGKKPIKPKEFQDFPYIEKTFDELPKLPTEWKWVHWNEVLDYQEDAFKRGPFGSTLTKSIFVKKGYKVYEQYCPINDDISFERYYITPEKYDELKSFSVSEGDYLISCAGTIGKITQVPEKFKEGVINQALLRLRINKKHINNKFFLHFFRSPYFQKQIFENSKGSSIPNMKGVKELKIIPVPLLSIEEQNIIVEILESRFTLVDNLVKTVDNILNEIIALKYVSSSNKCNSIKNEEEK